MSRQRANKNILFKSLGQALLIAIVALSTMRFLNQEHMGLAPLGPLLNPFHGIWRHHSSPYELAGEHRLTINGVKGKVRIVVDRDQIKHLFADNDDDLYFAQGYLLASERLWQMEFLSRMAAGRLSEVIGRKTIGFDEYFVKSTLPEAAARTAENFDVDGVTGPAIRSYVKGVNAFIKSAQVESLPLEYSLLNIKPEPWSTLKSALLLKLIAWSMTARSNELALSRSRAKIGKASFASLFPLTYWLSEPIMPTGLGFAKSVVLPKSPSGDFEPSISIEDFPKPNPNNGSNSWTVMGKKSVTGLPILSNDIHLDLVLPSLWYEMQIKSPSVNAYGITMPGAPGIVLGFNENLAWSVTSAQSDELDWYELRFRDAKKSEYFYDGLWRPVVSKTHQIGIRGEQPETVTIRETHFGPIVDDGEGSTKSIREDIPKGAAMRWVTLEAANELKTFMLLNRAKSTGDCPKALESFSTPPQNFTCADNQNNVGLWHTGKFPIRWRGQGRLISDGTNPEFDWHGWVPQSDVPAVKNPPRGFVSSANQNPANENYPYYLGSDYDVPFRAIRINEILKSKAKFTPADFVEMQHDTLSVSARTLLPLLLKGLGEFHSHDDAELRALDLLKNWDDKFTAESSAAVIYQNWSKGFLDLLWGPWFPEKIYQRPSLLITLELLNKMPDSAWFGGMSDNLKPGESGAQKIIRKSFIDAIHDLKTITGESNPDHWHWGHYRPTDFAHLSHIPGLGDYGLFAGGMEHTIFANNGHHGPVWKQVVALGKKGPEAWAMYPGGQSGDATSKHYDDFVGAWVKGEMKKVVFLKSEQDSDAAEFSRWTVSGDEP